ncbi:MAG: hypothetical protein A4E55_00653 [Pelotomaculum sp. PtaU1.Bin035]|nr:MAG: hypothetical protein A4E55_00653 [Pelotomaculum sp. PtaU1.Bin035]
MDYNILKTNITSLQKFNFFIIESLLQKSFLQIDKITEEKSNNGMGTLYFHKDAKKYLLHSKYNPVAEAERIVQSINFNKDSLIIVFGLGLGYHLFELKDKISEDTRVFIIEHNMDVLKYTLTHVDLSPLFDTSQFFLIFGDEKQMGEIIVNLLSFNFYNMSQNIQTITLPNYHVYADKNQWVMKQIAQRLRNTVYAMGNSLDDMFVGFRNNYLNIEAFMKSNGIDEIKDVYKDFPAIIVASGPSLDKNIHHLKDAYGKAVIISCDASLRACEKLGIKPDAVASIERDEPTYTYYYKDRKIDKDIVLVGPGVLWPKIFEEYMGKTIIIPKTYEGNEEWWYSFFKNLSYINQGQSSATVAFAVAKAAGCNPIILIGQDLAFTDGKIHSDQAHTEYEGENNDSRADDIYLEDYQGNLLRSNRVYRLFRDWYEYQITMHPDLEVIDATEGGAYIHGSVIMTLEEAIEKYCTKPLERRLVTYLADMVVTDEDKLKTYEAIIQSIDEEIKKLKNIKKKSIHHYKRLLEIEKKLLKQCNSEQLERIVLKMQAGDKIIQDILYEKKAIGVFYHQIIVQTIIYVKKIGNMLTLENVRSNHQLQMNLMYIIEKSTDFIVKEYEKARLFIEEKKHLKQF